MSVPSGLAYLRSNASQQLRLDAKNKTVPYNDDSLPGASGMYRKVTFVDNQPKVDFINKLPSKISCKMLRMLDNKSLGCATRVSRKWKIMCGYELILRKCQLQCNNGAIEETNAYYEQLWELLMWNIEKTYGQRFPF